MRHDPRTPMGKLAWNRPGLGPYWFHYTTPAAARRIVLEQLFIVMGGRRPPGMYVTDIQPGQLEDEALLNAIFDGTRSIERVQAAVILHDDPALPLQRVGASAWVRRAAKDTRIQL